MDLLFLFIFSVLCLLCLCVRLLVVILIFAPLFTLWSPAGKGLTSWLLLVVSKCEYVTFPLIFFVRYGFVCLFDFILNVPSIIFQLNRDGSSWVEPLLS